MYLKCAKPSMVCNALEKWETKPNDVVTAIINLEVRHLCDNYVRLTCDPLQILFKQHHLDTT